MFLFICPLAVSCKSKLTVPCHDFKFPGHVDDHTKDLTDHLEQRGDDQISVEIEVMKVGNSAISLIANG